MEYKKVKYELVKWSIIQQIKVPEKFRVSDASLVYGAPAKCTY